MGESHSIRHRLDERTYRVETPHGIYRCNTADLKKTMEPPADPKQTMEPPSTPHQDRSCQQQTFVEHSSPCPQTPVRSPEPKSPVTKSPLAKDITQAKDTPVKLRTGRTHQVGFVRCR